MADVNPIPEHYPQLTPYLVIDGAEAAIAFYGSVFGASERVRLPMPDGTVAHCELQLGNSLIMLEQPFVPLLPGEQPQMVKCRMRSLGCSPCTGAVRSDADTIPKIIDVPALTFSFWRLWLGAVLMALVLIALRRRPTRADIRASIPGGVLFGLNLVLFFTAIKETSIVDVLVIGALQPALTLLVAGRMFSSMNRTGQVEGK